MLLFRIAKQCVYLGLHPQGDQQIDNIVGEDICLGHGA
jgi:hypothetical protein